MVNLLCLKIIFVSFWLEQSRANDEWWKHGVFYQIYPRSFKDSNNDGDGDLRGIISKISYLKETGLDGVWLSPVMKSPQVDAGYDISDYYAIDKMYGTIDDLKELIDAGHKVGLKIILDFVPNHTSNQHEWFEKSENDVPEFRDHYVWVNASESGGPPNNWISVFGGSAWQWSDKRKQYYLHQFLKEQPDLNYRNPTVRKDMQKVLIYYLDLGIDGFRVDAVPFLLEDKELRNEPVADENQDPEDFQYLNHTYTSHIPETYEVIHEWRKLVDEYSKTHEGDARILMTEAYGDLGQTLRYYGTEDGSELGAHFTFNFLLMSLNRNTSTANDLVKIINEWQNALPSIYVSNWVLGNHDNHRIATRLGVENVDGFNMLIQLSPGIAITYNGDEFGQEDGEVSFEERRDTSVRSKEKFLKESRDFERTPIQWDDSVNAGFNNGAKPWLPVSKKYTELNLASQLDENKLSHYQIYKKLTQKRKEDPARIGSTEALSVSDDVIILKRKAEKQEMILVFKLGWRGDDKEESIMLPFVETETATVSLTSINSSYEIGSKLNPKKFSLKPHESIVLDITYSS